jgi:GST-like protein
MVGDQYTLVDMALWGWARVAHMVLGDEAQAKLPHVKRLVDEINARPAAQRVEALKSRHTFKTEFDAQARKAFFPHMQEAAR